MYGGGPTLGGTGAIAGTLAATGANPLLPIIVALIGLTVGALLLVRERMLARQQDARRS